MTKGAPVFLQPPKVESKVTSHKSKYQPHVHFSRSLTNGSNGEQHQEENFQEALQDVQSRLHKGRPGYQGRQKTSITGDEMFENQEIKPSGTETGELVKKKSVKKSSGGARPKSSRAGGKRQKTSKTPPTENLQDLQDQLLMEPDDEAHEEKQVGRFEKLSSPGQEPHSDSVSKHDSEAGDINDDTSKDFTSLSLATASASGGKQTNPKISVTDDAQ